jgi:hypothetical protein
MSDLFESHDMTKPVTKEDLNESTRSALELYQEILADLPAMPPEYRQRSDEMARESADHLRWLFSDLDDNTLAAFAAYNFMNLAAVWASSSSAEVTLLGLVLYFGSLVEQLAWQLGTPEAPEPEYK